MASFELRELSEEQLIAELTEKVVAELEEFYQLDLTDGATIAELKLTTKARPTHVRAVLDAKIDADLPLFILSPRGFTEEAAELAWEYEDTLLFMRERRQWVPLEIPA